jgi:hypothetical protein
MSAENLASDDNSIPGPSTLQRTAVLTVLSRPPPNTVAILVNSMKQSPSSQAIQGQTCKIPCPFVEVEDSLPFMLWPRFYLVMNDVLLFESLTF